MEKQKTIRTLKSYHNEFVTNFRHYLDEKNKRDLIMSISKDDNNIRVWNIKTFECVSNINSNYDLRINCTLIKQIWMLLSMFSLLNFSFSLQK